MRALFLALLVACGGTDSDPAALAGAIDCGAGGPACGDGTCDSGETTATCLADCPAPPICNANGTCDAGETTQNCAVDCPPAPACNNDNICDAGEVYATCMTDCDAAFRVQNNASYTIFYVYAKRCADAAWGPEMLDANVISPGVSATFSGLPPDCWNFKANDSGFAHTWMSANVTLVDGQTYLWTLLN